LSTLVSKADSIEKLQIKHSLLWKPEKDFAIYDTRS